MLKEMFEQKTAYNTGKSMTEYNNPGAIENFIYHVVRDGKGAITVDTIGGDFNLRDAIDLDYFKDKLFAALKIPRSFLGFEDDMPGSLGNTSLVRMDIRYARTVRGLQNILSSGIKDLLNI